MQCFVGILIPHPCKCRFKGLGIGEKFGTNCSIYHILEIKDIEGNVLIKNVDYQETTTGIEFLTDQTDKILKINCSICAKRNIGRSVTNA